MTIEISLLGPVEATSGGKPVDLGSPQQRALLVLLAARAGAVVPMDVIVDALWPTDPPASANKVVQTYVSRLRKALGEETLERRGAGYSLNRSQASVDAERFEWLVRDGQLTAALSLWRGRALAGVVALPAMRREAERLEELRVRALEGWIDAELEAGNALGVLADLHDLVMAHPLREDLISRLMIALYRAGRQAEALELYRKSRSMLVEELGIEPAPELRDLERRILEHDPALLPESEHDTYTSAEPAVVRRPVRRRRMRLLVALSVLTLVATAVAAALALARGSQDPVVVRPNSIVRIDSDTNEVAESISVGREPSGIVATSDAVWVANERDRTLTRVDTRTQHKQTIGGLNGVGFVARDDHGNIYASGWDYPYVWRIDPRKVEVAERFRVRSRAVGMAIGGGSLWVVDRLVDGVTRIDLAEPKTATFVSVGADPLVAAFGYGALWVANSDDGTVSVIRPGVGRSQTIEVSAKPFGIAAGEGAVWVASYADSTVTRIDPELRRVAARIEVGVDYGGLYAVAAGAGSVWAAYTSQRTVVRIDPKTNEIVSRIKLDVEPRAIAIDGDDVWVSVALPGTT
jgi:DNA-binding SARP family transcriptional activator/DNA-binding beta-propeller fold protein YncE